MNTVSKEYSVLSYHQNGFRVFLPNLEPIKYAIFNIVQTFYSELLLLKLIKMV